MEKHIAMPESQRERAGVLKITNNVFHSKAIQIGALGGSSNETSYWDFLIQELTDDVTSDEPGPACD